MVLLVHMYYIHGRFSVFIFDVSHCRTTMPCAGFAREELLQAVYFLFIRHCCELVCVSTTAVHHICQ